jgi:hypothetical protein
MMSVVVREHPHEHKHAATSADQHQKSFVFSAGPPGEEGEHGDCGQKALRKRTDDWMIPAELLKPNAEPIPAISRDPRHTLANPITAVPKSIEFGILHSAAATTFGDPSLIQFIGIRPKIVAGA